MNNQEDSILKTNLNEPNEVDIQIDKNISISTENIWVQPKQTKIKQSQKKNNEQVNVGRMLYFERENSRLRKRNQQLVKKLQLFSQKLDKQLQKRSNSQSNPQKSPIKVDQSIQLKNAYKKIQIYKRQIGVLKSKHQSEDKQFKINDYQNKLKLFMTENQQLRQQIKTMKKIIKQQERGLIDIGAEGFMKINQENVKNKQEIRKLLIQLDQSKRKCQSNNTNQNLIPKSIQKRQQKSQKSKPNQNQSRKKANSSFRMRTQPTNQKSEKSQTIQKSQEKVQQKCQVEKLQQKIKKLNFEKSRQKEITQNLKTQISQKDKQIVYLKQKIDNLRITVRLLKKKTVSNNEQNKEQSLKQANKNTQTKSNVSNNDTKTFNKRQSQIQNQEFNSNHQISKSFQQSKFKKQTENSQKKQNEKQETKKQQNKIKYPRIQEKGEKIEGNSKWNHHQFSSKIKEISVYFHNLGFIHSIHAIYDKGQPAKINQFTDCVKQNIKCQQNDFIQQIEGSFQSGYLQSLTLKTNNKKTIIFCKNNKQKDNKNFKFTIAENEFPCALFGENDNQGIRRLGCFIDKKA